MFLEQIEHKQEQAQLLARFVQKIRSKALQRFEQQQIQQSDMLKNIGIKFGPLAHEFLKRVQKKYKLRSKSQAVVLAVYAGCSMLLSQEELSCPMSQLQQ